MVVVSPSGFLGSVVATLYILILPVIYYKSACGWCPGSIAHCQLLSLVAFGACGPISRTFTLWFVNRITLCTDLGSFPVWSGGSQAIF